MSAAHLRAAADPEPDDESAPGEEAAPAPRGIVAMPDLRPYCDVRRFGAYGPALKRGGPVLLRAVGRFLPWAGRHAIRALRILGRGTHVLAALGAAWLSGDIGTGGSTLARAGIALGAGYAVVRLSASHPAGPWIAAGGTVLVVALAGRLPKPKPDAAAKAKTAAVKPGLLARFARPRKAPPDAAATAPAAAPETPAEPPLTALVRELIGADNGVHLSALRPAMRDRLPGLSGASDSALNQALREAGFDPSQKFRAGGLAGCAGVHRTQLPPLSPGSTPGALSAPLSGGGEGPRPANSPHHSPPLSAPGEEPESGIRWVHDPALGPSGWRIDRP